MAYREPKVPQIHEGTPLPAALRALILFLREDCAASWNADRKKDEEIRAIKRRLDALERR